jgi:hypothetical protein
MDNTVPKRRIWLCFWLVALAALFGLLASGVELSAQAAPAAQLTPFPTPTSGVDGRILYVVQQGDTLWRIAAITGVTLDELRGLNRLGPDDIINPGDILLIGMAGPEIFTPTPGPASAPEEALSTPTVAAQGTGTICVILYNDIDGNAIRQEAEGWIRGGQISLSDRSGEVSETEETAPVFDADGDIAYLCFADLPPGEYIVTLAIPEGYNPTTVLNRSLALSGGDEAYLSFGAQANSERIAETAVIPVAPGKSPLLAIAGGILLAIGVALGIYAGLLSRR